MPYGFPGAHRVLRGLLFLPASLRNSVDRLAAIGVAVATMEVAMLLVAAAALFVIERWYT